ncbi:MAG: hypothetical protein RL625_1896 [Gemmatimonadota bacterium]
MTPFVFRSGPEPRYKDGELKLSANHIALLVALRTFPDGTAPSLAAWFSVALRMKERLGAARSFSSMRHALHRLNEAWLTGTRSSGRWVMSITPRGSDIAECRVPTRIVGLGAWEGLPPERSTVVPRAKPGRPDHLPSLQVPGVDLEWRPESYPRDFIEIARLTVPSIGFALSYCAKRVGRSWLLRAERFPRHDPLLRIPRRFAVRPLSLREVTALIDGTQLDEFRSAERPGFTLIDLLFDRHASGRMITPQGIREYVRVTSACYPELERFYAGRAENRVSAYVSIRRRPARRSA